MRITPLCSLHSGLRLVVFALLILFAKSPLAAQIGEGAGAGRDVVTSVKVSKAEVYVAEMLEVIYQIETPADTQVTVPEVGDKWGDWQVIDQRREVNIPLANQRRRTRLKLQLESLATGQREVPPLEFSIRDTRGSDVKRTAGKMVQVASAFADPGSLDLTHFEDIHGAISIEGKSKSTHPMPAYLLSGLALVGAFLAIAWVRRGARASNVDALAWVFSQLDDLSDRVDSGTTTIDSSVSSADATLRHWLSARLAVHASSMSTSELVAAVEPKMDSSLTRKTQQLFSQLEHARYSGETLTTERWNSFLADAKSWVTAVEAQAKRGEVSG